MISYVGRRVMVRGVRLLAADVAADRCTTTGGVLLRRLASDVGGGGDSGSSSNKKPSSSSSTSKLFRPRRRSSRRYRPVLLNQRSKAPKDWAPGNDHKFVEMGNVPGARDELEAEYGPLAADLIRSERWKMEQAKLAEEDGFASEEEDPVEEYLRMADYLTSPPGSVEDLVGERRGRARDVRTDRERMEFEKVLKDIEEDGRNLILQEDQFEVAAREKLRKRGFGDEEMFGGSVTNAGEIADEDKDPDVYLDPNQVVHGEWSEMLITVDRNIKLWRGGRLESYRALVIGGNLNGCGGFGVGKANDPIEAVNVAGRKSKRNVFFVDRYQGNGLTRDLVGKQNSCIVHLRATDNGLRGNELCREILKRFGITNCSAKSHGNRTPYNVVLATFKALQTHESLEEICLKRGKRLLSIDRAMRMGL